MPKIDVLKQAVETFGWESQIEMAIEECAELIDALCKLRRGRVGTDAVITEIADVQIMMEQLCHIFGFTNVANERVKKIARLKRRIKTYKEKNDQLSENL